MSTTDMMNLSISRAKRIEELEAKIEQLEDALKPFAEFAEKWEAAPIRGMADEIYMIHGGVPDKEGSLRLSDCRKARAALQVGEQNP